MMSKDSRLIKYPRSEEYFRRTWRLFPKFKQCWLINTLIYLNIAAVFFAIYVSGGMESFVKNIVYIVNHELIHAWK